MCQQGETPSAFSTIFYRTDCKQCNFFFSHWLISERESCAGMELHDTWLCALCLSLPSEVPACSGPWAMAEHPAPPWHCERLKSQILIHFCPFTQLAFSPRPQEQLISLGPLSPTQDGTKEQVQTVITSIFCAHHQKAAPGGGNQVRKQPRLWGAEPGRHEQCTELTVVSGTTPFLLQLPDYLG